MMYHSQGYIALIIVKLDSNFNRRLQTPESRLSESVTRALSPAESFREFNGNKIMAHLSLAHVHVGRSIDDGVSLSLWERANRYRYW